MANYIVRPVWYRPEMLQLSIDYEIAAREYYSPPTDLITLFCVEHGAHEDSLKAVKNYPYPNDVIVRPKGFSKPEINMNLMNGMIEAAARAEDYFIGIWDDVLIHETYFQYINAVLSMDVGKFGSIQAYNKFHQGNPNEIYRGNYYKDLAMLVTKEFTMKYLKPFIPLYFKNVRKTLTALDNKYKKYYGTKYLYRNLTHMHHDGLIRRLTCSALIEEDMAAIMPMLDRQIHAGFYGVCRPGGSIPGKNFDERLEKLKEIVENNKFYEYTKAKQYDDYRVFSPKLDEWDGTLKLVEDNYDTPH